MLKVRKLLKFNVRLWIRTTCLLILVITISASAQQAETNAVPARRRVIFTVVEHPPEFSGGNKALQSYLEDNLKFPEGADKKFRNQRVFTRFIITETGAIDSVQLLKPVNDLVDAEAIRVIKNMPAWQPGKQNGHAVAVWYNIPVHFNKN